MAAGAGFVSNFVLWNESGYFDKAADAKPLLHLWSLGIEEQFYAIWPALLWAAWKLRFNLLAVTCVIAGISFILNVKGVRIDATAAFYSPQTRIWELLTGSVLAWFSVGTERYRQVGSIINSGQWGLWRAQLSTIQAWSGAALIAAAVMLISKETRFPGWWALMPTLGTALVIAAGDRAWLNRVVLSNRMLVWVGVISFPLYRWHWPLLSFARIVEGEMPTRDIRLAAVAISIILAWMTYRFIEWPIRFGKLKAIKAIAMVLPMLVIGGIGYGAYAKDGLRFRSIEESVQRYMSSIAREDKRNCLDVPFAYKKDGDWFCTIGGGNKTTIFVYGDSHANSLLPALERLSIEGNLQILFASGSGCLPLLGVKVERGDRWLETYNCPKLNERIFQYVKDNKIKNVFLVSRWTYYDKSNVGPAEGAASRLSEAEGTRIDDAMGIWYDWGIKNTVRRYGEIGVNLYIFEDNPNQMYDPLDALKKARPLSDTSINKLSVLTAVHRKDQAGIANKLRDIGGRFDIVSFDESLCERDRCPLVIDGKFIYFDRDHLSKAGALHVYSSISRILPRLEAAANESR